MNAKNLPKEISFQTDCAKTIEASDFKLYTKIKFIFESKIELFARTENVNLPRNSGKTGQNLHPNLTQKP